MLNNFIYAKSKAMFEERIAEVPNEAIVFIEDTKEIWNHGHYFAGEGVDPVAFDNLQTEVSQMKADKQDTLISGTNIKTINGNDILGEGNIDISGYDDTEIKTNLETVGKMAYEAAMRSSNHENAVIPELREEIAATQPMISVTWSELKEMRDNATLKPGQQYRITDYVTTTSQADTQSAGHPFDVIVTADSENTLNEEARACLHEGDTYFSDAGANLAAWQIWYSLDNDVERFAWADWERKGVIYRMIDEWDNDCPYDFKNIQFKHPNDTTRYPDYYYTFSTVTDGTVTDHSMRQGLCYGNTMKEYINSKIQCLNNNVFINSISRSCFCNSFENDCHHNSFKPGYYNYFGKSCHHNSFDGSCYSNLFGNNCFDNSFGYSCYENSFGSYCHNNLFGGYCHNNLFGNSCYYNSFGNSCDYNSFGNSCDYNSFRVDANITASLKNYVQYNHFDDGCCYNVIWNSSTTSSRVSLKNINVNRGVSGTSSNYNFINIDTLNADYEIQVAKNSKGEIKIYCEADLIA